VNISSAPLATRLGNLLILRSRDRTRALASEGVVLKNIGCSRLKSHATAVFRLTSANAERRRAMSTNVIGWIEGSDPVLKNEVILYTAHYDHDGVGTSGANATKAVINFDMIGRDEAPGGQTNGSIEIATDTTNEVNLAGMKYSPDYRSVLERAN